MNASPIIVLILIAFAAAIAFSVSGTRLSDGSPSVNWRRTAGAVIWLIPVAVVLGLLFWEHASIWRPFDPNPSAGYRPGRIPLPVSPGNRPVDASASGELPAWASLGQTYEDGQLKVPVHSEWQSTEEDARSIARLHAIDVVRQEFQLAYPNADDSIEIPDLNSLLVLTDSALESKPTDLGPVEVPMYRAHFLLQIDDESRQRVLAISRVHATDTRLVQLGIVTGLLTLIWTAAAIYFRLDLRTESRYRGWLRTAFSSIVFAGALSAHFGLTAIEQGFLISAIR